MVLSSVPDHATHVEEDQLCPGLPDNYQDKTSVDTLPQKRESLVGMLGIKPWMQEDVQRDCGDCVLG
jgi:hypothetical protein